MPQKLAAWLAFLILNDQKTTSNKYLSKAKIIPEIVVFIPDLNEV
jgi:hypothetical protein